MLSYLILRDDASVAGITAEGRGKLPYELLKLFPFIISPNQFQEKTSAFLQHEVIFIFEATCPPPPPPPLRGAQLQIGDTNLSGLSMLTWNTDKLATRGQSPVRHAALPYVSAN